MITNLKPLNKCFDLPHFKADHWGTVLQTLSLWPNHTWWVTLDLRNWFFHLALHPQAQRWVRVRTAWAAYQFLGLPFGLSCSPYWTTKLAKVVISHQCSRGMVLVWYIDDILLLNTSSAKILDNLREIVTLLNTLGVQLNQQKCHLTPCQTVQYLGQHIDLNSKRISPTASKLLGCKRLCKQLTLGNHTHPVA